MVERMRSYFNVRRFCDAASTKIGKQCTLQYLWTYGDFCEKYYLLYGGATIEAETLPLLGEKIGIPDSEWIKEGEPQFAYEAMPAQ